MQAAYETQRDRKSELHAWTAVSSYGWRIKTVQVYRRIFFLFWGRYKIERGSWYKEFAAGDTACIFFVENQDIHRNENDEERGSHMYKGCNFKRITNETHALGIKHNEKNGIPREFGLWFLVCIEISLDDARNYFLWIEKVTDAMEEN